MLADAVGRRPSHKPQGTPRGPVAPVSRVHTTLSRVTRQWYYGTRMVRRKHLTRENRRRRHAALARDRAPRVVDAQGPGTLKIGSWNTRGLGAPAGKYDQTVKLAALCRCWEAWNWDVALLQDLQYPTEQQGIWEFQSEGNETWTLIVAGKVGIAMNASTTAWWRTGGARWEQWQSNAG